MKKKMTMQDIAKECNVAKSTISRYFNGGYVKEETRARIQKVIERNNYEPNAFAQSLKAKNSRMIGIVAPCLDSVVSSRTMMAADAYLRKEGYTSLIKHTNHQLDLEIKHMEDLWRMKVDGIILLATQVTAAHKKLVSRMDIPVIFVGQEYTDGISIINDDYRAAQAVGAYVQDGGFSSIVYLGVSEEDPAVGKLRKQGFLDSIHQHVDIIEADFHFESGYHAIKQWDKPVDLIVCATDMLALGAFKAIQEKGWKVPEEVSLIGFGGYEVSALITPALTTIKFDNETAGYLAGETMLKLLDDQPISKRQIIGYTLQVGGSVRHVRNEHAKSGL